MNNKKGSPERLGRPAPGEWRHPTSGEAEFCSLRRNDRICIDATSGEVVIQRCAKLHVRHVRLELKGHEAERIIADLQTYWNR